MRLLRSSFLLILLAPIRGLSYTTFDFTSPSEDELVLAGSPYTIEWDFETDDPYAPETFDLFLSLSDDEGFVSLTFVDTIFVSPLSYIWTPSIYDASISTEAFLFFNSSDDSDFYGTSDDFTLIAPAANSVSSTPPTTVTDIGTAYVPTTTASSSTTAAPDTVLSVVFVSTIISQQGQQTSSGSSEKSSDVGLVLHGSSSSLIAYSAKATVTTLTTINGVVTSITIVTSSRASSTSQPYPGLSNETNDSFDSLSTVAKAGIGAAAAAIVIALLTILGVVLFRRRPSIQRSKRIRDKHAVAEAVLPGGGSISRPRSDTSVTRTSFSTGNPPTTTAYTQQELATIPVQQFQGPPRPNTPTTTAYAQQELATIPVQQFQGPPLPNPPTNTAYTQQELATIPVQPFQGPPRPNHADLGACITNPAAELENLEGREFTAREGSIAVESQAAGRAEIGLIADNFTHESSGAPGSRQLAANSSDMTAELNASERAELAAFRAQRASQVLAESSASTHLRPEAEQHPVELLVDRLIADQQSQDRVKHIKKVEGFNFDFGR